MSRSELVNYLLSPQAYSPASEKVELRETHISYVFLTGAYAYKLKKPLDLGFANFTSIDDRKKYCLEEVRRNQLYSPGIYLDVIPVSQGANGFSVGQSQNPVDYLVRMRQFDDSQLASSLASRCQLTPQDLSDLAQSVAGFHQTAGRSLSGVWGTPSDILLSALENFRVLRELTSDAEATRQLDWIENWTVSEMNRLTPTFNDRKERGFVRQCHGDLHLGNLVRWQGSLIPFDCIEFNPDFYWIDVLSEIAFLVMDLDDHGLSGLGWHFLNAYLEHTGDYAGLKVFRFYLVYRAMVRAKICELRLQQNQLASSEQQSLNRQWRSYLNMAVEYTQPVQGYLAITHGVSGSGKTYHTQSTIRESQVIRIRSDVERKRKSDSQLTLTAEQFGTGLRSSRKEPDTMISLSDYSESARDQVYEKLADLAESVLDAEYPVLIDATFLKLKHREQFRGIANARSIPFYILKFEADRETLIQRIDRRLQQSLDASEATAEVLEQQLLQLEPLGSSEANHVAKTLPNRIQKSH